MKGILKRHKALKRALVILLVTLLSFAVFSVAASAFVFEMIFARTDTHDEALLTYTDVNAESYPRKRIDFYSDGTRLCGYLYGDELEDRCGTVLIAGGIQSTADRYLSTVMFFVDNGWCVFCYSGTGVGESEGDSLIGLTQSRLDLDAAIDRIASEPRLSSLPLVIYGHSVGGYAALTAADKVAAVVSIGAFDTPNRTMLYYAKQYVGAFADIEYPFMCLHNRFLFGEGANLSAVDAVNATDTPVLIIEGSEDTVVPKAISVGSRFDEITNPNASYIEVSDALRNGHSNVWLSADAAQYGAVLAERDGEVTAEERLRSQSLDTEFMEYLISFFNAAISE